MRILEWEWMRNWKKWVPELAMEAGILFVVFLGYKMGKNTFFDIMNRLYGFPEEVYCFLGIEKSTTTGNILFFLLFVYMLLCVWNIWQASGKMIQAVYQDERTGMIQLLCGQNFSRRQLVLGKMGSVALLFAAEQILLGIWLYLWAAVGSVAGARKLGIFKTVAGVCGESILTGLVFLGICFLYAVVSKRDVREDRSGFVDNLVFLPWIAGNLYKVRDVIFYGLDKLAKAGETITENLVLPDGTVIEQMSTAGFDFKITVPEKLREGLDWLDRLYWISPLSWMNPFRTVPEGYGTTQTLLCVLLCAGSLGLGIYFYERHRRLG